jgi:hypothetical protein
MRRLLGLPSPVSTRPLPVQQKSSPFMPRHDASLRLFLSAPDPTDPQRPDSSPGSSTAPFLDPGVERKGPRVLEVAELWFDHVMNVRHYGPDVKAVFAGDRNPSHLPPLAATAMSILMLSAVGFFAVQHTGLRDPAPMVAGDRERIRSWEKAAGTEAAAARASTPLRTGTESAPTSASPAVPTPAGAHPADPLSALEAKRNEEMRGAFLRAQAGNRTHRPLAEPSFDLYLEPDHEAIVRETLLPYARSQAPLGKLDKRWTDLLSRWSRDIDILDDPDTARIAEDLPPGTRVVRDGRVLMIRAGIDPGKVQLGDRDGHQESVEPTAELRLWVPEASERAAHAEVFQEIQELLWAQYAAKSAWRGLCEVAENLVALPASQDRWDVNARWASCLVEEEKWDAARPFLATAMAKMPQGELRGLPRRLAQDVHEATSTMALRDAFGGDWKTADPGVIPAEKRAAAEHAAKAWRAFTLEVSHDPAALGAVNEQIHALEEKRIEELAAAGVRNALSACGVVLLLLPLAVGFDHLQKRRQMQDFFVPGDLLPSNHFAIAEQVGGQVRVNFTKDSVGWLQRGSERTATAQLIGSGRAQDRGGVYQVELADGEGFVNDIGKLAFYVQRVHRARAAAPTQRREIDWMFGGVLLFLLSLGGLFALRMATSEFAPTQEGITIPDRMVELSVEQVEKEKAAGQHEAGEGARAKGDEGKTGRKESQLVKAKGSRVAINQSQMDKSIAESSGLMAAMRDLDSSVFSGSGLGESVSGAIGGLLGSVGTQHGAGLGSRGDAWGNGGGGEGINGIGILGGDRGGPGNRGRSGHLGTHGSSGPGAGAEDPIVLGTMEKWLVDRVVKQHLTEIRYCYEKELAKNPKLFGKVVTKFVIAKDGTVSQATTKNTTMKNPLVESCVVTRFERMRFPPPRGGGIVVVSYPFVFHAQGG